MFNEICIYEAKIDKQDEIEALMKEVAEFIFRSPALSTSSILSGRTGRRASTNHLSITEYRSMEQSFETDRRRMIEEQLILRGIK